METIKFKVKGSAKKAYKITFTKDGENLNAYCTCSAGQKGKYCKHRINILAGNKKNIVSNNVSDMHIMKDWVVGSDIEQAYMYLAEAENDFDVAKKQLSHAKKLLAVAMHN